MKRFDNLEPDAGFVSVSYQFPVLPGFGNWTVAAYYGHQVSVGVRRGWGRGGVPCWMRCVHWFDYRDPDAGFVSVRA